MLPVPSALNLFPACKSSPRGSRNAFRPRHSRMCAHWSSPLNSLLLFDCCRLVDTSATPPSNTEQLALIHVPYKPSLARQILMKCGLPKCCQRWRFDGSLVRGLHIILSSPAVVWQNGILPAVSKDTAINWRGLTAAHYGAAISHSIIIGIIGEASANGVTKQRRQIIQQEKRSTRNGAVQEQLYFCHSQDTVKLLCSLAEFRQEKCIVDICFFFLPCL